MNLLIKLCFQIENLNAEIDEKIVFLTEDYSHKVNENCTMKALLENEIKELVSKFESKTVNPLHKMSLGSLVNDNEKSKKIIKPYSTQLKISSKEQEEVSKSSLK